jgi:nucleotide-binding universal stress UspA family protein
VSASPPRRAHVLATCDFSVASAPTLAVARAVAEREGADVVALHVVPATIPPAGGFHALPNPALLDPGTRAAALRELKRLIGRGPGGTPFARAVVEEGRPADVVLEAAERIPARLIVVGTHGRGALARAFLGSTAEAVLSRARCPVLFVPPSFAIRGDWPRTALWATDFSPAAAEALDFACASVIAERASVIAVHAITGRPGDRARSAASARRLLRARVPAGSAAEIVETEGGAAAAVVEAARRHRPDLVVVGASGRGQLAAKLFGSTTLDILRSAPCPVLVAGQGAAGKARKVRGRANPSPRRIGRCA